MRALDFAPAIFSMPKLREPNKFSEDYPQFTVGQSHSK